MGWDTANHHHKAPIKHKITEQDQSHGRRQISVPSWTTPNNLATFQRCFLPLFWKSPSHTSLLMGTKSPKTWDMQVTCWRAELGWLQCSKALPILEMCTAPAPLGSSHNTPGQGGQSRRQPNREQYSPQDWGEESFLLLEMSMPGLPGESCLREPLTSSIPQHQYPHPERNLDKWPRECWHYRWHTEVSHSISSLCAMFSSQRRAILPHEWLTTWKNMTEQWSITKVNKRQWLCPEAE